MRSLVRVQAVSRAFAHLPMTVWLVLAWLSSGWRAD